MPPFVVYWNNIPSPYMVERFNALADRNVLDFEAWFNDRIEPGRSWTVDEKNWRFRYRYMPVSRLGTRQFHWPWPILGRRPDVLVSLYAKPSFLGGWVLARVRGVKTGIWVEVTFDKWFRRRRDKEYIKRWLFRRVDAIVTVGTDGKQYAEKYGVDRAHIFYVPHVIDVAHYRNGTVQAEPQRVRLRTELGLQGTTFLYVGRLWWGKGLTVLLDAFHAVQAQSSGPVSLLLVGDGPEEECLKEACNERGISNVVFVGFQQKHVLPRYYALADVFVFPTLGDPYGLVIDEAMACGLPVISTESAGEIHQRIEEGVNGYIVPAEDSKALAARMAKMAFDPGLRARMGAFSKEKMEGCTPERWASDFEGMVGALLRKERAR